MKHTNQVQLILMGIGFASFLGMNSFSLWGLSFLPQFAFGESVYFYWSAPIALSNILGFLIYLFGSARFPQLFNRAPFPEAVLFLAFGMILLLGHLFLGSALILIAAGSFAGIGTTCCFISWEKAFALSENYETKKQILLGSVLVVIPCGFILSLDQSILLFVMLLLVFCNLSILYICLKFTCSPSYEDRPLIVCPRSHLKLGKKFWKSLLCIIMVGTISPVLGSTAFAGERGFLEGAAIVLLANGATSIILGVVWFAMKKETTISGTYIVIFPVLITAFLVFPFLDESYRVVILTIGSLSFTLFSVVMMTSCIRIARDNQLSLVFVYTLFAFFTYSSRFLGEGLAVLIKKAGFSHETQIITSVLLLLYACSLVMFFLMRKAKSEPGVSEQVDVLGETCRALAMEKGLSDRQTEVLDLLVHGYDVPSIARKLYISQNTVRSHTKKIYALLGVHSKQEIVELVNEP